MPSTFYLYITVPIYGNYLYYFVSAIKHAMQVLLYSNS